MTFYNPKTRKLIEVLNDLIRIHNDRIAGYEHALDQVTSIDTDLQDEFNKIISRSLCYRQQLLQKVNQLSGSTRIDSPSPIVGKIYRAWMDLKIAFSGITQKAIIASCQYNEEIALHTYKAALSVNVDMAQEMRQMIENQESEMVKVYEKIKKYRETTHVVGHNALYLA